MFLREMSGQTLTQVADQLNSDYRTWSGVGLEIKPHLTDETPHFSLESPGSEARLVPSTPEGIKQISAILDVPPKTSLLFGDRDPELQQIVFQRLLARHADQVTVRYDDNGVSEIFKSTLTRIEPRRLVEAAMRVIATDAPVVEWAITPDEFYLDTIAPETLNFGRGGDRAVGDITAGGLVIGLDRKHNLAPTVARRLYRLACTNGYETRNDSMKVDARGLSVEQVLAEFEEIANRAFQDVEAEIESFYETRNERIEGDVTQAVIRIAAERGLPDRTAHRLAVRVPEMMNEVEERMRAQGGDGAAQPSMFDLINLITNQANDPALAGRRPVRQTLYRAGGDLITEHHERCSHCQQRLS
jgi:hypothetical protein